MAVLIAAAVSRAQEKVSRQDPVDALSQALRESPGELVFHDPESLQKYRTLSKPAERDKFVHESYASILARMAQSVQTLPDLRRAVTLVDWPGPYPPDNNKAVLELRQQLIGRLARETRKVLHGGSEEQILAALAMISRTASATWAGGKNPLGELLQGDVVELFKKDRPARVREMAARTLGEMIPDPDRAVAALRHLLDSKELNDRRAASDGLRHLARFILESQQTRQWQAGEQVRHTEIIAVARPVLPTTIQQLADSDPVVRRTASETARSIGEALLRYTPPPNTNASRDEAAERRELGKAWTEFIPLLRLIAEQVPALARAIEDSDLDARLAANQALETVADARRRFLEASKPGPEGGASSDPLTKPLQGAAPALATELKHPEVRVRLAALYALESFESEAAGAVDAMVEAAKDSNPFVRWGVARVLGKIAPGQADKAVPVLTNLAADSNGDIRLSAVDALRVYGPRAQSSVGTLGRIVDNSLPDVRVRAIEALAAIGRGSEPALPALIKALAAKEANVRAASAKAIGQIRSSTSAATEALVKALADPETDVRMAASDALLSSKK
jgi:HEAT repeat protein